MSMLVWGGSAWLWGHGASRTGCMGEQDHQPPHCSGGYPGRGFGPCPVQLCWGQGEGPQASCIHRHIPIMSYPIAYGQHPQPCAQPGEPCTLLPASLPARIPPCLHPSLPASLPARQVGCGVPSIAQSHANSSTGTAGLHISSAAGIHQHIPRQLGRMQDVLGHGHGMCQHMDSGRVRARQQDESRCREQPLGLDRTPQWLVMGRKASPHHGHHDPAHGLGVRRAWSNLGLNPTTSRTPRRLLPRTRSPMQTPAPRGLRARQGLPWGLQREFSGRGRSRDSLGSPWPQRGSSPGAQRV